MKLARSPVNWNRVQKLAVNEILNSEHASSFLTPRSTFAQAHMQVWTTADLPLKIQGVPISCRERDKVLQERREIINPAILSWNIKYKNPHLFLQGKLIFIIIIKSTELKA